MTDNWELLYTPKSFKESPSSSIQFVPLRANFLLASRSQSIMSLTSLHSFCRLPDQFSFRSSSCHSGYSKIMHFAIALRIIFLYIICYGSLSCLILGSYYRSHMIILYMNWESTYTQKEIKINILYWACSPTLTLLQFKGLWEAQKLCFSAPCGHTALHAVFGGVQCLNPKISPYVMTAALSYKISWTVEIRMFSCFTQTCTLICTHTWENEGRGADLYGRLLMWCIAVLLICTVFCCLSAEPWDSHRVLWEFTQC